MQDLYHQQVSVVPFGSLGFLLKGCMDCYKATIRVPLKGLEKSPGFRKFWGSFEGIYKGLFKGSYKGSIGLRV